MQTSFTRMVDATAEDYGVIARHANPTADDVSREHEGADTRGVAHPNHGCRGIGIGAVGAAAESDRSGVSLHPGAVSNPHVRAGDRGSA